MINEAKYALDNHTLFTKEELSTLDILVQKSDSIVSRDEIAQSVWGDKWLSKYSDWEIDRLVYLVRKKLTSNFSIKTIRTRGYSLQKANTKIPPKIIISVPGIIATDAYLEYMNNPNNPRKVLYDLFKSIKLIKKYKNILVINSYSVDNIDAIAKIFPNSNIYFSNFDNRALTMHQDRITKLKLNNIKIINDDIRDSIFKDNFFDLIVNDFRLNFNTTDLQNQQALQNIFRILKTNGQLLISIVIDPRKNTNREQPFTYSAQEGLTRFCFTQNYYQQLFIKSGFKIISQFDKTNGQKWSPQYCRYLLQK